MTINLYPIRGVLFVLLTLGLPSQAVSAEKKDPHGEEIFLNVLKAAYDASCNDVDRLRDYYRADAEIIHDGRQSTTEETIKDLEGSLASTPNLTCSYQPRVRSLRVSGDLAYLVVRETIRISSQETGSRDLQQICSYVFLREGGRWKIAVDHCSSVEGETV